MRKKPEKSRFFGLLLCPEFLKGLSRFVPIWQNLMHFIWVNLGIIGVKFLFCRVYGLISGLNFSRFWEHFSMISHAGTGTVSADFLKISSCGFFESI